MLEDGDQYVREYRAPPYPTEEVYAAERVEYVPPRGGAKAKAPAHVRAAASAGRLSVAPPCVTRQRFGDRREPAGFPHRNSWACLPEQGLDRTPPTPGHYGIVLTDFGILR